MEDLVEPGDEPAIDEYRLYRYHPMTETLMRDVANGQAHWLYHMVNSTRPLEEKMTLFWHHVFATGDTKIMNTYEMTTQIKMLRKLAMGNYKDLLLELAKNPAMIYWLDNNENHKREPNENWRASSWSCSRWGSGTTRKTTSRSAPAHSLDGPPR